LNRSNFFNQVRLAIPAISNGIYRAKQDERCKSLNSIEDRRDEWHGRKRRMSAFGNAMFKIEHMQKAAYLLSISTIE